MIRDNIYVSWSCWESFRRQQANFELELYWHVKCKAYDAMNTRTKAFWKSLSPSTLVNHRAERDLRRSARGDVEGPAMLLESKIEPQDDDELPLHRPQLYGNFCAMVAARSLVQSIEMTGYDHHTALQKPTF